MQVTKEKGAECEKIGYRSTKLNNGYKYNYRYLNNVGKQGN